MFLMVGSRTIHRKRKVVFVLFHVWQFLQLEKGDVIL